ncbi:hypothetical protein Gotri_024074 [Gossypium trilobum]|uniref:DUF4283 domain-containing protein n=1 Tax=Gossypium trilobum TaxID=34281 RepID=A0A7J9DKZ2_9ROSI|nr:hypothetical protein [Gossypium trilobum]
MEEELENLNISDDEEEILEGLRNADESEEKHRLCLVGRVLTDSVVHFPSIRSILANLWRPVGGISITDIWEKRSLFKFYHEIDLKRVLWGKPRFFNIHLILFHRLEKGEE